MRVLIDGGDRELWRARIDLDLHFVVGILQSVFNACFDFSVRPSALRPQSHMQGCQHLTGTLQGKISANG